MKTIKELRELLSEAQNTDDDYEFLSSLIDTFEQFIKKSGHPLRDQLLDRELRIICVNSIVSPEETLKIESEKLDLGKPFTPNDLIIMNPENFAIKDILVKDKSQIVYPIVNNEDLMPATLFSKKSGGFEFDVANDGDTLSIVVVNLSDKEQDFRSTFFGTIPK